MVGKGYGLRKRSYSTKGKGTTLGLTAGDTQGVCGYEHGEGGVFFEMNERISFYAIKRNLEPIHYIQPSK